LHLVNENFNGEKNIKDEVWEKWVTKVYYTPIFLRMNGIKYVSFDS